MAENDFTARSEGSSWVPSAEWYGERHRIEREKYAETLNTYGGVCMERVCILPSRRIEAGASWHLAHDHERGGQTDYLGPAHPECNRREAQVRRGEWIDFGPAEMPNEETYFGVELPAGIYEGVLRRFDEFELAYDDTMNWLFTYVVSSGPLAGRKQVERLVVGRASHLDENGEREFGPAFDHEQLELDLQRRFTAAGVRPHEGTLDPHDLLGVGARFRVTDIPWRERDIGFPYEGVRVDAVAVWPTE